MKLRVPVKIFGSIFGRFNEMIRYFESFGFPHDEDETGDIENFDYLRQRKRDELFLLLFLFLIFLVDFRFLYIIYSRLDI